MTLSLPEHLGAYRILRKLGEGGMGTVFLAENTTLKRLVAIKWLKQIPTLERLNREAQLQARIEHPAVCRLYEIAEHEGCPFLVMQYIEGLPINQISSKLSFEVMLRIMVTLADALHTAHQKDLIHRDLKPSNILVEVDEAGTWRPFILDFGLARDMEASLHSEAGRVMGSPAYMAPEQIDGGWVDRRADVYALGATFFEVFAGRPPFLGETTTEVLAQVQSLEAPLLRTLVPDLPADLETILRTCLAKDPAHRYPSAAELRDDLQRVLDGMPIHVRHASLAGRSLRWMRRNKLSSALATVVCLSLLVTGGVWIRIRQKAQAQAYWAQRFGQEILQMDGILRFGRMLPPHDLSPEFEQVRQRMEIIRAQMKRDKDSQGPGHSALGEGYLLLGQLQLAHTELEATWNSGYRSPEVSLALGNCFIELYNAAYQESLTILDRHDRTTRQAQIRKEFLDPALTHLKHARQELGSLPRMEEIRFALAESRFDEAAALAKTLYLAEPWRVEVFVYLARALNDRGLKELEAGQLQSAKATYEKSLDFLDSARRTNPSDERLFESLAKIWSRGRRLSLRGTSFRTSLERALECSEQALALNNQRTGNLLMQAWVFNMLGEEAERGREDPEPWFQRAETVNRKMLEAGPSAASISMRANAYCNMIDLAWSRAIRAQNQRQDVGPIVEEGLRFLELAQAEGQVNDTAHMAAAGLYSLLAKQQEFRGEDCTAALEHSADAMERAAELRPRTYEFVNLVGTLDNLAEWKVQHDQDPGPSLRRAHEVIHRAQELSPGISANYFILGNTILIEALWAQRRKQDAQPILEKARVAYEDALAANEKEHGVYSYVVGWCMFGLAKLHALAAEEHLAHHEDPTMDARKALIYGQKVLAMNSEKLEVEKVRQTMTRARKILAKR